MYSEATVSVVQFALYDLIEHGVIYVAEKHAAAVEARLQAASIPYERKDSRFVHGTIVFRLTKERK